MQPRLNSRQQDVLTHDSSELPLNAIGLKALAWLSVMLYGGLFVYLALRHIFYPGFIETTEGDVLQQIARIAHGLTPYPKPGGEFISLPYLPLYQAVSAPLYLLFGDSFMGPRIVSCVLAVASGVLVGLIAWRETRSAAAGCVASALYFSGFRIMDAYLTAALPDSMMLFWLLLGLYFFAYGKSRLQDLLWLLFFSLAFWTRQHGAFFFGFAALYGLIFRKNYLPKWSLVAGTLIGGPVSYLLLGRLLGDGFFLHTFVIPGRWEHGVWFGVRRSVFILACTIPFSTLLTAFHLKNAVRWHERRIAPLAWFALSTLFSATFTMTSSASSNNHYIPLIAVFAATAGAGFHALATSQSPTRLGGLLSGLTLVTGISTYVALKAYDNHHISQAPPFVAAGVTIGYFLVRYLSSQASVLRASGAALLVIGQFGASFYNPGDFLPVKGYQEELIQLQAEIAKHHGRVIWIPYGYVPASLTGIKILSTPSCVATDDIERQKTSPEKIQSELQAWGARFNSLSDVYILSHTVPDHIPACGAFTKGLKLVEDFGDKFSAVRQITFHWYSGGEYPRYLYVKSPTSPPAQAPDFPAAEKRELKVGGEAGKESWEKMHLP
jgi:4-amino-4-deoxy-L-arabinose transferase-like glycosyltransferase